MFRLGHLPNGKSIFNTFSKYINTAVKFTTTNGKTQQQVVFWINNTNWKHILKICNRCKWSVFIQSFSSLDDHSKCFTVQFAIHPFTDTHSYSASISSTFLFYEGQLGVQHLAKGHFGMQMGKTGDRTAYYSWRQIALPLSHSWPDEYVWCSDVQNIN